MLRVMLVVFSVFVLSACTSLCVDEETVATGLDREGIRKVIREHNVPFQHCYEKEVKARPALKGTAIYQWDISEVGAAEMLTVKRSLDPAIDQCMLEELRKVKFPPSPKNVIGRVSFPFAFEAKK